MRQGPDPDDADGVRKEGQLLELESQIDAVWPRGGGKVMASVGRSFTRDLGGVRLPNRRTTMDGDVAARAIKLEPGAAYGC